VTSRPPLPCRWLTDSGPCLGHPTPGTPELCERHLALLEPWITARARAMAQGMRPAIERQIREELRQKSGRSAQRRTPATLNPEEQRLLQSLIDRPNVRGDLNHTAVIPLPVDFAARRSASAWWSVRSSPLHARTGLSW
jgi:hypothetical protein